MVHVPELLRWPSYPAAQGAQSQQCRYVRLDDAPRRNKGFPKLGGAILGVPIIKNMVFEGLYWGQIMTSPGNVLRLR